MYEDGNMLHQGRVPTQSSKTTSLDTTEHRARAGVLVRRGFRVGRRAGGVTTNIMVRDLDFGEPRVADMVSPCLGRHPELVPEKKPFSWFLALRLEAACPREPRHP